MNILDWKNLTFEVRNIELLKWAGVFCMVVDHIGYYVFGVVSFWPELIGAQALPLFAVALGAGLANQRENDYEDPTVPDLRRLVRVRRVIRRLAVWALVAQLAVLFVRDGVYPFTILTTLWCGVMVFALFTLEESILARIWKIGLVAGLGFFAEFSLPGVFFVAAVCLVCQQPANRRYAVAAVCFLIILGPFNGGQWALLSIPIVYGVGLLRRDVGRVRGVFYWLYVLQFPIFWAARRAFF